MSVPEIDVDTLAGLPAGATVIDVREFGEYEEGHVSGARLIPLSELQERVAEVPTEGTVYLICRTGGRSARAAEYLIPQGVDAVNIAGGTKAWVESGRPVVPGGDPA